MTWIQSVAQIQAFAKEFQKEYLNDLQLGVVTYQWKDQNGLVKEASSMRRFILRREVFWHPVSSGIRKSWPASRIRSSFRLHWPLKKGSTEWQVPTQVPNLKQAELQQVGFRLEDELAGSPLTEE